MHFNTKKYTIIEEVGTHRECKYYELVGEMRDGNLVTLFRSIAGVEVALCRITRDHKWWIIPAYGQDDENIDDIGPYDDLEDALMHLYLRSDPSNEDPH